MEKKDERKFLSINRSFFVLLFSFSISFIICYLGYILLINLKPLGFIILIPGAYLSFQTLWFFLNPFALIFDNRIEIKQSLLKEKIRYFVDIKKIILTKNSRIILIYNDNEQEHLNLFGIKKSEINHFYTLINDKIL